MDEFQFGCIAALIAFLAFFGGLFIFLHLDHTWNVGRDEYLMSHCKVLQQVTGGETSTKEFTCVKQ